MESGGSVGLSLRTHPERTRAHVPGGGFFGPSSWQSGKHRVNTQTSPDCVHRFSPVKTGKVLHSGGQSVLLRDQKIGPPTKPS